jgi:hypothetical protein
MTRIGSALGQAAKEISPRTGPLRPSELLVVIQGRVTDTDRGGPIADVCVWFGPVHIPRTDRLTNCVFTDSNGMYARNWVRGPQTLALTFEAPSYVERTISCVADKDVVVVDAALTRDAPPAPDTSSSENEAKP